jgi:hypothetical protein
MCYSMALLMDASCWSLTSAAQINTLLSTYDNALSTRMNIRTDTYVRHLPPLNLVSGIN